MRIGQARIRQLVLAAFVVCSCAWGGHVQAAGWTSVGGQYEGHELQVMAMDSGAAAPADTTGSVITPTPQSAYTVLADTPTSTWTYGCSATAAGMLFGYYDRTGMANMYAGATNGGVAPLVSLGQGIGAPIPGACSIIATQNGFDGRTTNGHVDDYWISTNSPGPDPFEGNWTQHTWGECTADYMGTNQWKWDLSSFPGVPDGTRDNNKDGATSLWSYASAAKLYDYTPGAQYGLPETALSHGLRLFAESRGYSVVFSGGQYQNYTQKIDARVAGGFSFADYMAEIDAGSPVMIQVEGHSMAGVGYDDTAGKTDVILHDTWDDLKHTMAWGGSYAGMLHEAVTVIQLNTATAQVTAGPLNFGDVIVGAAGVPSQNVNVAEIGGLTRLDYAIGASPSGFTAAGAGSGHYLLASQNQNHATSLNTGTVGDYSGGAVTVTDAAVSPAALANVTLDGRVLAHSEGSLAGGSDLDALTLDFGAVGQGSAAADLAFSIHNLLSQLGITAGLDLDLITPGGDSAVLTTDLGTFSNLAAASSNGYLASFDTSTVGSFSATYTLDVSDQNLAGATDGTDLVLTLTGIVTAPSGAIPEPQSLLIIAVATLALRRRRR